MSTIHGKINSDRFPCKHWGNLLEQVAVAQSRDLHLVVGRNWCPFHVIEIGAGRSCIASEFFITENSQNTPAAEHSISLERMADEDGIRSDVRAESFSNVSEIENGVVQ